MITVPKSAIEESDDSGEAVSPGVGDTVTLEHVTAKVTAVKGDSYELEVQSVNGCDCGEGDMGESEGGGMPKDGAALLLLAKKEDKKNGLED